MTTQAIPKFDLMIESFEKTLEVLKSRSFVGGEELFRAIVLGGGWTMHLTQEHLDAVIATSDYPEVVLQTFKTMTPGHYVCMLDIYRQILTTEETMAIQFHEEAHIVYGHIAAVNKTGGIVVNPEWEIQADAYSVEKMGTGKYMRSGLIKIVSKQAELLEKYFPKIGDNLLEQIVNDQTMVPRLERLESMVR